MRLLIDKLPGTSIVSIGHRPGLEAFHSRELTLEPGKGGARLSQRKGARSLREVYRRVRPASHGHVHDPADDVDFWSTVRRNLGGPPRRRKK